MRRIVCEMKTDDGEVAAINLNAAEQIVDTTGAGSMILHVGDKVEMGVNDTYVADKVFIVGK